MSKSIYVSGLSTSTTEEELRRLFQMHGEVHSVEIIAKKTTGDSRKIAYVRMNDGDALKAINGLDQAVVGGNSINVKEGRSGVGHGKYSSLYRSVSNAVPPDVSAEEATLPIKFLPVSIFNQTCGHCGAIFRVEVARPNTQGDLMTYRCPACHHHACRVNSSMAPVIKLLSKGKGNVVR